MSSVSQAKMRMLRASSGDHRESNQKGAKTPPASPGNSLSFTRKRRTGTCRDSDHRQYRASRIDEFSRPNLRKVRECAHRKILQTAMVSSGQILEKIWKAKVRRLLLCRLLRTSVASGLVYGGGKVVQVCTIIMGNFLPFERRGYLVIGPSFLQGSTTRHFRFLPPLDASGLKATYSPSISLKRRESRLEYFAKI